MSVLHGKTIVITRPVAQATAMVELLQERGAVPYLFPLIETVIVENLSRLKQALQQINNYDWLVFTSVNAVKFFFMYSGQAKLHHLKIAAIGPKTAQALEAYGIKIHDLPQAYVQEGLAHFLKRKATPGEKVLFPKAVHTRDIFTNELIHYGLEIDEVPIYQTQAVKQDSSIFLEKMRCGDMDVLTFTSSSTVTNFVNLFQAEQREKLDNYLKEIVIASIGPITSKTAIEHGLQVEVEAKEYTVVGLVNALEHYYQKE